MNFKRFICLVIAVLIVMPILSGCGGKGDEQTGEVKPYETMAYPLNTDETLSYWMMGQAVVSGYKDRSEYPITKEYEEKIGVKINWIFPTVGNEKQEFGLLLASGNKPDIIDYYWYNIAGGPQKALDDLVVAELNPLIEKYSPNFRKYLDEHPDMDKQAKTDSGKYYYYPGFAQYGGDNDITLVTSGYLFRQDWLEELNLPIPETISDWYTTLKAFKEKGVETPITLTQKNRNELTRGLAGAWNIKLSQRDFYVDGDVVKYGFAEPAYKDFLTEMNKWYNEGLMDKNVATLEPRQIDAAVVNGKTGAVFGWLGSDLSKWQKSLTEKDSKAKLIGVPFPVANKGDVPKYGQKDMPIYFGGAAITQSSKKKELAAKVLDYGYSPEGHNLFNFGIEGVSYNMENDYPRYTELLFNNPNGLSVADAVRIYTRANPRGPFVQDKRYIEQYYTMQEQKDSQKNWLSNKAELTLMPQTTLTSAEEEEFNSIMQDIEKYVDEQLLKFITNVDSISNFDSYISKLKSMKIDRAIELKQAALDRYNSR